MKPSDLRSALSRGAYRRPMAGWWRRDPFFVRYMWREVTAIAVLVYAIVLLVGVVRLAQGQAAFDGWLAALRSPLGIGLHAVLFVALLWHAYTWFQVMPKTLPLLFVDGHRVSDTTIRRVGYAAAIVGNLFALVIAWILTWGVRP